MSGLNRYSHPLLGIYMTFPSFGFWTKNCIFFHLPSIWFTLADFHQTNLKSSVGRFLIDHYFLSKQISDNRTRQTSTQLQKLSLTNLEYPIIPSPDFSQIGSPDLSEWKVARMFLKRLSNKHQQLYNLLLNKQSLDFLLLILFFSEKPTDTPFPKIHKQSDIFTRLIRVEGPFKNFSNVEFSIILPFHRQTTHHFYLIRTIDFNP